ncbi:MAG: allophanate hydrolase [Alcanivorax sp.]|mgnify:CR=1 FL=1|nr:allophanate hydrolase [Alcanivorax sp.]MBI56504.1 allophanate hydrolase [Alcanivorax sp.]MBU59726.1 allophanate hydrolase [Alcanivorax sp.]UWN49610.1 Allophanate hydrolase [Alcanivorax sp. ALC70]HCE39275.1 allophanate hydrolase [Alcanivorax sp.]
MLGWTIDQWRSAYRRKKLTPVAAMKALSAQLQDSERALWIHLLDESSLLAQAERLSDPSLPLYGVPFAVKDNIDVGSLPTTAACPAYAYTAKETAPAVQALLDAGAILVGKTNLDQLATGLVGVRSPYGEVPNPFNGDYVTGGSSSGSAAVVSLGLVPFALGTDTAGSGRVPAALTNIVGLKPTKGSMSTRGVVPACRTLDCISVFAVSVDDAETVFDIYKGYDERDGYARHAPSGVPTALPEKPRLGVPKETPWFGDDQAAAAWQRQLEELDAIAELVPMDLEVLHEAARLLYQGPWVAERYTVAEPLLDQPDALLPVIRDIILPARDMSAADGFRAQYKLADLRRQADQLMADIDALVVPSTPGIYTRAAVNADPVTLNSQLGTWTNFVNLLDMCALSLPGGLRDEDRLPTGITLIGPAWYDAALAEFGRRWQRHRPWRAGVTDQQPPLPQAEDDKDRDDGTVTVAVVGAHLSGMPLNYQLTERNGVLLETTRTAPCYRLYALANTTPPKPGLIRADDGAAIEIELWKLPVTEFGSFVALIPGPLGMGTLETEDGRQVKGFICEGWAIPDAKDITALGGWRNYIKGL